MDAVPLYEIRVRGRLDARWAEWFSGMAISYAHGPDGAICTLTGRVVDQAALRGILDRIWDLNLTLVSLKLIKANPVTRPDHGHERT